MTIFKPPTPLPEQSIVPAVFLAGSIEMNTAIDWQARVEELIDGYELNVFNPRRDDWDSSWKQNASEPNFVGQVTWELDALDLADYIIMYFDPATKSPISLLELGLYAMSGRLRVVCPEPFWRKGNVDIVCRRYGIKQFDTILDAVSDIIYNENIRRIK